MFSLITTEKMKTKFGFLKRMCFKGLLHGSLSTLSNILLANVSSSRSCWADLNRMLAKEEVYWLNFVGLLLRVCFYAGYCCMFSLELFFYFGGILCVPYLVLVGIF